jgi:hypothetical protein
VHSKYKKYIIALLICLCTLAIVIVLGSMKESKKGVESNVDMTFVIDGLISQDGISLQMGEGNGGEYDSYSINDITELVSYFYKDNWKEHTQSKYRLSIFSPYIMIDFTINSIKSSICFDKSSKLVELRYGDELYYYTVPENVIDSMENYIIENASK